MRTYHIFDAALRHLRTIEHDVPETVVWTYFNAELVRLSVMKSEGPARYVACGIAAESTALALQTHLKAAYKVDSDILYSQGFYTVNFVMNQ